MYNIYIMDSSIYVKELSMLSPYITLFYFISVIGNFEKIILILTPITWIVCILGLIIKLYKRFIQKKILRSYIFLQLFGLKTDLPLIFIKFCLLLLLIFRNDPITKNGVILAIIILVLYIATIDIKKVYQL